MRGRLHLELQDVLCKWDIFGKETTNHQIIIHLNAFIILPRRMYIYSDQTSALMYVLSGVCSRGIYIEGPVPVGAPIDSAHKSRN